MWGSLGHPDLSDRIKRSFPASGKVSSCLGRKKKDEQPKLKDVAWSSGEGEQEKDKILNLGLAGEQLLSHSPLKNQA